MYLIFRGEKEAFIALESINKKMNLPTEYTKTWANVEKSTNEKEPLWFFKSPKVDFLQDIESYSFQADVTNLRPEPPKLEFKQQEYKEY